MCRRLHCDCLIKMQGFLVNMREIPLLNLRYARIFKCCASSQVMGAYFPILTFVCIGLEHSVANMFFIPMVCPTPPLSCPFVVTATPGCMPNFKVALSRITIPIQMEVSCTRYNSLPSMSCGDRSCQGKFLYEVEGFLEILCWWIYGNTHRRVLSWAHLWPGRCSSRQIYCQWLSATSWVALSAWLLPTPSFLAAWTLTPRWHKCLIQRVFSWLTPFYTEKMTSPKVLPEWSTAKLGPRWSEKMSYVPGRVSPLKRMWSAFDAGHGFRCVVRL